jgi:aminoglycoside phosphotransferase (APT) family kinase protein
VTSPPEFSSAGLDLDALRTFIDAEVEGGTAGHLSAHLLSGGKSNLTYEISDGHRTWVLRRPPLGLVLPTAHDMSREFTVIRALHGSGVPAPSAVVLAVTSRVLDAPFYLMDKVDGVVYRTRAQVQALSPPQRAALGCALVDTLADLHEIDPAAVGLDGFGRPKGYLERQLSRWQRQYDAARVRDLPAVEILAGKLSRALPDSRASGVVHGDYRLDNVMIDAGDPGRIAAVLDWEMATLGDPLADLGILISFWDEPGRAFNPITNGMTAFEGFPSVDEVVQRYATRRRSDVGSVDWYIVFGLFKIAIILEQIHARHLQGHTVGEGFDNVGEMVPPLLERAQTIAAASPSAALRR